MAAPEFHVEVPAPAGARSLWVELVYTTHGRSGGEFAGELIGRFTAAAPRLPEGTGRLSRVWCLPTAEVPVDSRAWRTVPPDGDSFARTLHEGLLPTDMARGTFWEP